MKVILLVFLSLFCNLYIYSQYGYKSGYIVNPDGTIEEGLILYKGEEFNAKKCLFKKDSTSDPVEFLPTEIAAYRFIDSKYFESKKVLIEIDETNIFLECLISGKASIYYILFNSKNHYFLEMDGDLIEINNNMVDYYIDDNKYQRPSNQYKGVFKYYFKDCPPVVKKLDHADFSKKSLINISKEYHEYVCKDEQCIIYEKVIPKKNFSLGFDFSYGKSKLEFNDINLRISMYPIMYYQFGINSQMNLNEDGDFNLKSAIRYYSYNNELLNDPGYSIRSYPSVLHYQYSMLKPEIQLGYKMEYWKIIPFISAGLFSNFFLVDKGTIYNERFDITIPFASGEIDNNKNHTNFMLGWIGEIGLETGLKPGNLSFSIFYEKFLSKPFKNSYNMGLRCGYYFVF